MIVDDDMLMHQIESENEDVDRPICCYSMIKGRFNATYVSLL